MFVRINSVDKVRDFVDTTTKLEFDVDLVSGRYVVDAKSIMGIFSLDLSKPIELRVYDAEKVVEAETKLKRFVA